MQISVRTITHINFAILAACGSIGHVMFDLIATRVDYSATQEVVRQGFIHKFAIEQEEPAFEGTELFRLEPR